MPTSKLKARHVEMCKVMRIHTREVATLAKVSTTTAHRLITGKNLDLIGDKTKRHFEEVIEAESHRVADALNRLSGGATGL